MTKLRIHRSSDLLPARGRKVCRPKKHIATMICIVCLFCAAAVIAAPAQIFTTVVNFNGTDGAYPYGSLIQARDGNFYGTTSQGGANSSDDCIYGCGVVFKLTPSGTLSLLYSFCVQANCADGASPWSALVQASDGNLYGTTSAGGGGIQTCFNGCGTVFKITPTGTLTTLHAFVGSDGATPYAGLVQAGDGNFYGITSGGGEYGSGTVFRITPNGQLTTLHNFDGSDGAAAYGGLIQASDGNFYGTEVLGGQYGAGTVFRMTPDGDLVTLHDFVGYPIDGSSPYAGLVQAADGNFYGTTFWGGSSDNCDDLAYPGCGTVFKMTPSGSVTLLYSFDKTHGLGPLAPLIQARDGNLYGTTQLGGNGEYSGTVFRITPTGDLSVLHAFSGSEGSEPWAGLVQTSNGIFYGITTSGGIYGPGTVFTLNLGAVRPCAVCRP